jgi:hypothetical protein
LRILGVKRTRKPAAPDRTHQEDGRFEKRLKMTDYKMQGLVMPHSPTPAPTPLRICLAACLLSGLAACGGASDSTQAQAADAETLAALEQTVEALQQRKTRLQDIRDIKRLQRAYGFYVDRGLWDEAAELFAEEGSIEIGLDGVYVGRERVREYLYALGGGSAGLAEGRLNEHMQLMPVITVADDGRSARGRWRALIMTGGLEDGAIWGEGPYENEYVKEDGVWKLRRLHWFQTVVVPYQHGWLETGDLNGGKWVSDVLPPDEPTSVEYGTWPATFLPPFHFPNPVTGE